MQLTGPPRLGGIVRRYASAAGPVQDDWDDRSTYLPGRARSRRKGPKQLWPSWSFRFRGTGSEWLALRSDLLGDADGEFSWTPRTRSPGDPEWLDEQVYTARVRGGLPTLSDLRRQFGDGQHAYIVDVEIEGVEPYEREPGAVQGGLYKVGESSEAVDVEPYGDAGLEVTVYEITMERPDGSVASGTFGYATVTPPPIEAARVRPRAGTNKAGSGIADVDLTDPPAEL